MDEPRPHVSPPAVPARKINQKGCLWAVVALQVVTLLVVVVMLAGIGEMFSGPSLDHRGKGVDDFPELEEVWAHGSGDIKVVKIPIRGMIMLNEDTGLFSSGGASAVMALRSIRRATHDDDVDAIILDIDSGGGGITASDIIYKALLDFKKGKKGRKVVAVYRDMAASGAYYVSMAADHIVAHPTTVTGSIGVIMQTLNIRELGNKIGIKDVTLKSGENKDLLSPFQKLTETQELPEARREILQGVIDEMFDHFVSIVVKGRQLPEEDVRKLADGRIFTARAALEAGLVDEIGYWDDAVKKTQELLGVKQVKIYRYEAPFSISALLRSSQPLDPVSGLIDRAHEVRLMYLLQL